MTAASRASVASIARYWAEAPELCDIDKTGDGPTVADLRFCLNRCADLLAEPAAAGDVSALATVIRDNIHPGEEGPLADLWLDCAGAVLATLPRLGAPTPEARPTSKGHTADPGRQIAKIALENTGFQPGEMLEEVIRYAFDQLCWARTTPQLLAFVESLKSIMDEDGQ